MESRGEAGRARLPDPPEPSLLAYNGPLIQAEALIYALAQAEIKSSLVGAWLIVDTQRAGTSARRVRAGVRTHDAPLG